MRKQNLIMLAAVICVLAWVFPVQAQIGAGSNPGTGTVSDYSPSMTNGWNIEPGGGFQGVYLDPKGSPWVKNFVNPGPVANGVVYTIIEPLQVAAGPNGVPAIPWSDFHETLPAGFAWIDNANNPFGFACSQAGVAWTDTLDASGLNVDWTFSPALQIGTTLTFTKYCIYTGPVPGPNAIMVSEYPTPEPSTIALLAAAAISALGYCWYRRRK